MSLFNFTSRTKPKTFTYIPRYYDEEKERFEELMSDHVDINDPNAMKSRISRGIKRGSYYYEKGKVSTARKKSNILTMAIGLLLVVLIIFVVVNNLEDLLKIGQ